jgi:photosystem II stability/assembly factor-like uncharacterized protein
MSRSRRVASAATRHARWRMGALIASCVLTTASTLATSDVLDRASLVSGRVERAVLLAITRANGRLVAVGEHGIIILSDDQGASWEQASVPVSVTLTSVCFATPEKGWAVGHSGIVLGTEDGGRTWTKQLDGRQAIQLMFDAAQVGGGPRIEAEQLLAEGPDKPFLDVHFASESRGFVVGAYGLIFATRDGGKTWLPWQRHIQNSSGKHLNSIRALGSDIYIAGEQGTLFRSRNAGETFVLVPTPYRGSYFGVLPEGEGRVVVFGLRGHASWSRDYGRSWRRIETGAADSLMAGLVLRRGSVVLVSQAGSILASDDGGESFEQLRVPQPSSFTGVVEAMDGTLVLSGARGIMRVPIEPRAEETRP